MLFRSCLDRVKPAYDVAVADGKAVGLGLGLKNSGLGNGFREWTGAVVRFNSHDDTVEVRHGWTEMGQGINTVALQVCVEELGVDPSRVRVIIDTTRELGIGQTTGSRGTLMGAGAVKSACEAARAGGCQPDIDYLGEYIVDWTQKLGTVENPTIHSTFGYAAQLVVMDRQSGDVDHVVAVHDVGRAVNPILCEGQIEGSVYMGVAELLFEHHHVMASGLKADGSKRDSGPGKDGLLAHSSLLDYRLPTTLDTPELHAFVVEKPDPRGPYGAKEAGEGPLHSAIPAVCNAIYDAVGIRIDQLPVTPEKVLRLLREKRTAEANR